MAKPRNEVEKAAGKLITALQKEWHKEFGEPGAQLSQHVVDQGHDLLQAAKDGQAPQLLKGLTVAEYLGKEWIGAHPSVLPMVTKLQSLLSEKKAV